MFDNVSVIFTLLIFCFFNCKSLTRKIVFESRMFGGEPVARKDEFEFKGLVALHNRVIDQFFCAGTLISPLHVLTGEKTKFTDEVMSLVNCLNNFSGSLLPAKAPTRETFTARIFVQNWPIRFKRSRRG